MFEARVSRFDRKMQFWSPQSSWCLLVNFPDYQLLVNPLWNPTVLPQFCLSANLLLKVRSNLSLNSMRSYLELFRVLLSAWHCPLYSSVVHSLVCVFRSTWLPCWSAALQLPRPRLAEARKLLCPKVDAMWAPANLSGWSWTIIRYNCRPSC